MDFLGNIQFSKTNAQGRKRYKKKLKPNSPGLLAHKEDRDKVNTSLRVVGEGRQWINTGSRLARLLK